MKLGIGSFVATAFLVVLALAGTPSASHAADEAILSFKAEIFLNADGTLDVGENITYDFGPYQRHGIYRDIPLSSPDGPDIAIRRLIVVDENGNDRPFSLSEEGNVLRIKIGDPDKVIEGEHFYRIHYTVWNAVRRFEAYDEVYWNATGDQWEVPIASSSAEVSVPQALLASEFSLACYAGPRGSAAADCATSIAPGPTAGMTFTAARQLAPGEGLTVAVGFPKGIAGYNNDVPPPDESASSVAAAGFLIPTFAFLAWAGMILLFIFGRRRRSKSKIVVPRQLKDVPVVVQYVPPAGVLPIDAGYLGDQKVDGSDISAVIIDLAIKGYLKIRYTEKVLPFWPDKKDYEFVKLKDGGDLAHPAYKAMHQFLFLTGDTATLSGIVSSHTGAGLYTQIKNAIPKYLAKEGFIFEKAKSRNALAGAILFFGVWGGVTVVTAYLAGVFGMLFGLVTGLFSAILVFAATGALFPGIWGTPLTDKGIQAVRELIGYKQFLEATDKDKLRLLNSPEKKPEVFEANLPYAIVFGVEEKWAAKFEGMYEVPAWLEGGNVTSATALVASMGAFSNSWSSATTAAHSSGSGGGGGGSSGGGSGGGGGGSW